MSPPVVSAAAMLCRVDPRGRLGLLFRRRVGPLLFRAGGREPCLLPLTPVGGFVASTPMVRTIERTSSMGMPLIDFVFAELEGEATVLFHLQTRGRGHADTATSPYTGRVNGCAEVNHLEWVALLPSSATRDVVHLPLVIDIPKRAGGVLHSAEIIENPPQAGE